MKLRTYLDQENIPRAAFAARIGVSVGALYRYLTGERFPRQDVMQAIIDHTGGAVQADDIFADVRAKKLAALQAAA